MTVTQTPLPEDYVDVDFQIEREDWNTYELKDGVKIKGRVIALRFTREKSAPSGRYGAQAQNIFVVFAPTYLRGPPSTPPRMEDIPDSKKIPMEIVSSNEVWNVYKIVGTGERVRVKLLVTDVFRVEGVYDQYGQPFYIIKSGAIVSPASRDIGP